jgi:hypothetical protein
MFRIVIVALALLAVNPADAPPPKRLDAVKRGMTMAEVKSHIGAPPRTARQILFRRHLEQWHYDDPAGWVEFQCVKGEEPFVLGVYPAK